MFVIRALLLFSLSAPVIAAPYFVHCYDFGCKSTREVRYSEAQWNEIKALFRRDLNSFEEKQAIRQAVATMERISGEMTGTYRDQGGNLSEEFIGQHDCIDESTNTFQYLSALQELNLLKSHRVDLKQRRIVWLATHWTAVIAEIDSGDKFAVDSWYRDNGELPYIQPLQDWRRKRDFPAVYNPELAAQ